MLSLLLDCRVVLNHEVRVTIKLAVTPNLGGSFESGTPIGAAAIGFQSNSFTH